MARKANITEAGWKASTKFFGKKEVVRIKIRDAETVVSEKGGIQVLRAAEFINITKADGYVPQTEQEEKDLLHLASLPASFIIELSKLPKSADAQKAESENIDLRNELREKDMELERLRAIAKAAGLNTDED